MKAKRVAILGAGLSGSLLAHFLKGEADVVLFDKSRGYGGRLSAWWADPNGNSRLNKGLKRLFDLSPLAREELKNWVGFEIEDNDRIFSDIAKSLAEGVKFQPGALINNISHSVAGLSLWNGYDSYGRFDDVIVTFPASQSFELLNQADIDKASKNHVLSDLSQIEYDTIFTIILKIEEGDKELWKESKKMEIVRDVNFKRLNKTHYLISIDSTAQFGNIHLNDDKVSGGKKFLDDVAKRLKIESMDFELVHSHKWKYAIPKKNLNKPFLSVQLERNCIYFVGDYFTAPPIMSSYSSSKSVAAHFLGK